MSELGGAEANDSQNPQSLQEQFDLFRIILAHLPVNLFAFDREGVITLVSGSIIEKFGLQDGDPVGQSVFDLFAADPQMVEDARRVLSDGITCRRERPFFDYVFDTHLIPYFGADQQLNGVIGVGINITEQKRLEAALVEHERLRVALQKEHELSVIKDGIMGRVSHEFRNPLAVIQMSADMLERHGAKMDDEGRARRFEQIHNQITHLTRILDDLAFSVKHSSSYGLLSIQYDVFDIRVLCEEVLDELGSRFGAAHQTHVEIAPDVAIVAAAPQIVHAILLQLLSNAYKYSDPGTMVTLQVDVESAPPEIVISVSDEGIGIPQSDREHLFEAFYRGSNFDERPGLGLGLNIVKEAVDLHEGSLTYETAVGQGTTFTVRLPMATHLLHDYPSAANGAPMPNGSVK